MKARAGFPQAGRLTDHGERPAAYPAPGGAASAWQAKLLQPGQQDPESANLLGHGSGSFGHVPASQYQHPPGCEFDRSSGTDSSKSGAQAAELNHLVMEALAKAEPSGARASPLGSSHRRKAARLPPGTWNRCRRHWSRHYCR